MSLPPRCCDGLPRSAATRRRDGILRARSFARGDSDAASQIRQRFAAGRASGAATSPAGRAAARAAGQAAAVAHMGAHALGAAAYAAKAAVLITPGRGERLRSPGSWRA